ncbi:hypothetical protein LSAT2_010029 [Lamellibrachia satsuma]|nr:hypothetical protein LSAT2_010029 [Lamellibrachia satsuma]
MGYPPPPMPPSSAPRVQSGGKLGLLPYSVNGVSLTAPGTNLLHPAMGYQGPRSYRSLRPDHGDDKGRLTAGAAGPVAGQRRVLARRTSMVRSLAKKPSSTHVLLYFFVFLRKTIREPTTFRNTYRKLRYFGQIIMPFCIPTDGSRYSVAGRPAVLTQPTVPSTAAATKTSLAGDNKREITCKRGRSPDSFRAVVALGRVTRSARERPARSRSGLFTSAATNLSRCRVVVSERVRANKPTSCRRHSSGPVAARSRGPVTRYRSNNHRHSFDIHRHSSTTTKCI